MFSKPMKMGKSQLLDLLVLPNEFWLFVKSSG